MQRRLNAGLACATLLALSACGSGEGASTHTTTLLVDDRGSDPVDPTTAHTNPGGSDDSNDSNELTRLLADRVFLSSDVAGRTLVENTEIRLSFQDDRVGVTAGCNGMGGTARFDGSELIVDGLGQTLMGCSPELEAQDRWLGEVLTSRPTLSLDGDTLTVMAGDTTITFVDRIVADPDRPLVGTTWLVDGVTSGNGVSSVPANSAASITISDDSAAVHTGCNQGTAVVEITAGTIIFSPLATTKMACESELMDLEAAVTSVLVGEVDYSVEAGRLTLSTEDADGNTIGLMLTAE